MTRVGSQRHRKKQKKISFNQLLRDILAFYILYLYMHKLFIGVDSINPYPCHFNM